LDVASASHPAQEKRGCTGLAGVLRQQRVPLQKTGLWPEYGVKAGERRCLQITDLFPGLQSLAVVVVDPGGQGRGALLQKDNGCFDPRMGFWFDPYPLKGLANAIRKGPVELAKTLVGLAGRELIKPGDARLHFQKVVLAQLGSIQFGGDVPA